MPISSDCASCHNGATATGKPGNQLLETRLEREFRFTIPKMLLQLLVVLNVVELAIPEGAAVRLPLRHGMGFVPLVLAILHPQPGAVTPGLQRSHRVQDALTYTGRIVRMNDPENRIGIFPELLRLDAEQFFYLVTNVGIAVGLVIGTEPIGKQHARHAGCQLLKKPGRQALWLLIVGLACHKWPVSLLLSTLVFLV
mgnify:CR=1 FL=1